MEPRSVVQVCRVHTAVKQNGYCRQCKAESERIRYLATRTTTLAKKRDRYHDAKRKKDYMADKPCEHDAATMLEASDIHSEYQAAVAGLDLYNCPDCGEFFSPDDEGNIVLLGYDPTEPPDPKDGASHAGKALAPQRRGYHRKNSTKVRVQCAGTVEDLQSRTGHQKKCPVKILLFPQNVRDKNYCPTHKIKMRIEQTRLRVQKFRQSQKAEK